MNNNPHEVNLVLPSSEIMIVNMFAVPDVGETIQIRRIDYKTFARYWTVDYPDSPKDRCVRVCLGLEESKQ